MTASPKPQQLIDKEQLRALGIRSDRKGLIQLALHLGLLLGLASLTLHALVGFHLSFVFRFSVRHTADFFICSAA